MKQKGNFLQKDSILSGILLGTIVPIILYAIILTLKDGLVSMGILPELWGEMPSSTRTFTIVALCGNLLVIHYFNRNQFYNSMRGLVFPTLVCVALWLWFFGLDLIGSF